MANLKHFNCLYTLIAGAWVAFLQVMISKLPREAFIAMHRPHISVNMQKASPTVRVRPMTLSTLEM